MPRTFNLACAIDNTDFRSGRPSVNEPSIKVIKMFSSKPTSKDVDLAIEKYNDRCEDACRVSGCISFEGDFTSY